MSACLRLCQLCLLLALLGAVRAWADPTPASNDLRHWSVDSGSRVLDGEWQVSWIDPGRPSQRVQLPYTWTDGVALPWGEVGYGRVTLSTRLLLPASSRQLALWIHDLKSAARVWVDGELVVSRGVPGDRFTEQPRVVSTLIPLPPGRTDVSVGIELSNHFHAIGGIEMPVLIGARAELDAQHADDRALYLLTLGGALFMSLFIVLLGRSNVREVGGVEFSFLLLLAAVRLAATGELLDTLLDWSALWIYRLEYLAAILFPAAYLMFLVRLFPHEVDRRILRLVQGLCALIALITLVSPLSLFSKLLPPLSLIIAGSSCYSIWVVIKAIQRQRHGSWLILLGVVPVSIAVINDLLVYNASVLSFNFIPLAVLGGFLSHGLALGRRVVAAMKRNIELSEHLKRLNASLELRVEQRTEGLRMSRDLLDSTLAHVQTALLSVDAQSQISAINRQFLALFGLSEPPRDSAQLLQALGEAQMLLTEAECRVLVPGAAHRWRGSQLLHLHNRRIIELTGRSLREGGWVCTYVDVTAQHLAEQRTQGGGVCHWNIDFSSHRLQVSERCWLMLGYPGVPAQQALMAEWLHPQDRLRLRSAMRRAIRLQSELYVDLRLPRQNGGWLWVSLRGRRILGRDQRPVSWVGAVEDIDRDWRAREALELARDQAQREARQTAELFSILSHELRTPLVAIQGYLTLLEADIAEPRMRERLSTVLSAAGGLTDVLDGVGALARAEGARLPAYAHFDARQLVRECIALVLPQAEASGLTIELQSDAAGAYNVLGSAMVLRQVLNNLLSNAIKFSERGRIHVSLATSVERLSLEISDSGPGIVQEQQVGLFDPFVRLDQHRSLPGTGLGLYVVRRLVDLSEGRVSMDSHPGAGVRVRVELPWSAGSMPLISAPKKGRLDGLYILLVDDIEVNLDVTRELLLRWGARVGTASSGGSAVSRCQYEDYDLVLMDMRMPDMDGLAASRAIREAAPGGGPLIVALTANAAQLDPLACQEAGLDGVLSKPLQLPALLRIWHGENGFSDAFEGESGVSCLRVAQLRDWLGAEACARLLPILSASLHEVRGRLAQVLESRDTVELEALVHRLRGSAVSFGLYSLAEKAAKNQGLDTLPALLAQLDEHLLLLQGWIEDGAPE